MGKHTMDFIFKVSGKTNFPHKILHSDKLLYNSEGRMKCFLGKEWKFNLHISLLKKDC